MPSPQVDALALAEHALDVPQLILALPPSMPDEFEEVLTELTRRRASREPLQQIVGYAAFRHLNVLVAPGVFLPRPETEVVARPAILEARRLVATGLEPLVVDLCTGSGVIALSVALEAPRSRVVAIDLAPAAVALTRANHSQLLGRLTRGHHLDVRIELGDVRDSRLLGDLDGSTDVVISNPPYIPDDGVPLDPEVADHEPPLALFGGGTDGLNLPGYVARAAARLLRPGGLFVMEHADVQGGAVRGLIDSTNDADGRSAFDPPSTHPDLTGRDRFAQARRRSD